MPIDLSNLEVREVRQSGRASGHWTHYYRKDTGAQVCGSRMRNKPDSVRCSKGRQFLAANGRCKFHGAKAGRPPIHGRYSQSVGRLHSLFAANLERGEHLDTKPDLALMATAAEELLRTCLEQGDTLEWREQALKLYKDLRVASRSKDTMRAGALLMELGDHLERGCDQARGLREAVTMVDKRAHRAQRERELDLKEERTLTQAQVVASYALILEIVQRNVPADSAARIIDECTRAMLPGSSGAPRIVEATEATAVG